MRKLAPLVAVGLVVLAACSGRTPDPEPPRPTGDTGTPAEEFQVAYQALVRFTRQMDEMRAAAAQPGQPLALQFPEMLPLSEALSQVRREAGRLGFEVGVADPAGPLGGDALFTCLLHSSDGIIRRKVALDLAVRHHPNDPRLGEYLYAVLGGRVSDEVRRWMVPLLDRVTGASGHPAVLAAARTGRGRLLLMSADPAEVAAGERLLEAVVRQHPDDKVGQTRVATWAGGVLEEHNRFRGGLGSPNVRLRP